MMAGLRLLPKINLLISLFNFLLPPSFSWRWAMLKFALAGMTAVAIAGSSLVYAQQTPAAPGATQPAPAADAQRPRSRFSAEDIEALADARIAGLKAGLRLTADQEKNWPAVEAAMRDLAKERAERLTQRRSAPRSADMIGRLRGRADAMINAAAGLKRLADASEPLYKSLDDGQKRRLALLSRTMGPRRGGDGAVHTR
jgi:hypothetical protein